MNQREKKHTFISIIIPVRDINTHVVSETLPAISNQTYRHFELIVLPNKDGSDARTLLRTYRFLKIIPTPNVDGPAKKRDTGAAHAQGEILAFLDDDASPSSRWLAHLVPHFRDPRVCGVGGPGVTPTGVPWKEEASGWFSASPINSGGYSYRFLPEKKRLVDDYPSMNLSVRKSDFGAVGGYDSHYYPGEDTKLCYDLVYTLGKKIVYDPRVVVYHHRRPLWWPHLQQNGNFGLHRGYFVRKLPKTSARVTYFLPSILSLGITYVLVSSLITRIGVDLPDFFDVLSRFGAFALFAYFTLLCFNGVWIIRKAHSIFHGLLSIPVGFITHVWYGIRFIQGLCFTKHL